MVCDYFLSSEVWFEHFIYFFNLCLFKRFTPIANFGYQSLSQLITAGLPVYLPGTVYKNYLLVYPTYSFRNFSKNLLGLFGPTYSFETRDFTNSYTQK